MADDIPAGWYPDIHGTVRWWDGERWTDRVRDTSATPTSPPAPVGGRPDARAGRRRGDRRPTAPRPTPRTSAMTNRPKMLASPRNRRSAIRSNATRRRPPLLTPQPAEPTPFRGTTVVHRPARTISYPMTVEEDIEEEDDGGNRRIWLTATAVGLAAFFLGMGIGGRTSVDPPGTSDPIPPAVNTDNSDIEQLRQQLEDRQAELDERQQVLDDREDELDRRASATPTPTPSPTTTDRDRNRDRRQRPGPRRHGRPGGHLPHQRSDRPAVRVRVHGLGGRVRRRPDHRRIDEDGRVGDAPRRRLVRDATTARTGSGSDAGLTRLTRLCSPA